MTDESARSKKPATPSVPGVERDAYTQSGDQVAGDQVAGDKVGGDKVGGHKITGENITVYIQSHAETAEPDIGVPPVEGEPPYMGLQYFDTTDADLFFGREALTAKLVARLKEWRFMAVVGASGSGKSSVVRAGLVPALQSGEAMIDGSLPPQGSNRWQIRVITPTAHPLRELAVCLIDDPAHIDAAINLRKQLAGDKDSLDTAVSMVLNRLGGERLLLVVDQCEELFTLCRDPKERRAFIDNLITAAETDGQAIIVITLRADFYHHCAQYDHLRETLAEYQEYIGAMSEAELRQAIEEPAICNGWAFEEGLVDLMLRDVGEEPGALPLLSHALLETWKRRKGKTMTLAGYQEAGGVHGAIAHTAERVYGSLTEDGKAIAKNIFLRLTELGEGAQDTRRRATLDELIPAAEKNAAIEEVLNLLADTRLITMHEDCAEVAHEALIREWPALQKWLEENRESLCLHRHLTEAAQAWGRAGRDAGDLYRRARLKQALLWANQHGDEMNTLEGEFLKASQHEEQHQARLRLLRWVGIAALITLPALLALVALTATNRLDYLIHRPLPMKWVTISDGEFLMGSPKTDLLAYPDEFPQHSVRLNEFKIMAYEVTNDQYTQCVRAGICSKPGGQGYSDAGLEQHPVTDVTWNEAKDFCDWVGGRLPTEAEWEKAARGGLEVALYPWGDVEPDCNKANYRSEHGECVGKTSKVGSYDPNGYGLYDMAGNVYEWVADWYDVYPGGDPGSSPDFGQKYRVVRGGASVDDKVNLRSAYRFKGYPNTGAYYLGFRCAHSP